MVNGIKFSIEKFKKIYIVIGINSPNNIKVNIANKVTGSRSNYFRAISLRNSLNKRHGRETYGIIKVDKLKPNLLGTQENSTTEYIQVILNSNKLVFLVAIEDLKDFIIANPSAKLEKITGNLEKQRTIIEALNVNDLSPFWDDDYGKNLKSNIYIDSSLEEIQEFDNGTTIKPSDEISNCEKTVINLFIEKKNKIYIALTKWNGEVEIDHTLIPVLYGFFDYALHMHEKNRDKYSKVLEDYVMDDVYTSNKQLDYHSQVLFAFGTAINNNAIRGDWWLNIKRPNNPIFQVLLFLGDLLLNEDIVYNYEVAPLRLYNALLISDFARIMTNEVYTEMVDAYEKLGRLD